MLVHRYLFDDFRPIFDPSQLHGDTNIRFMSIYESLIEVNIYIFVIIKSQSITYYNSYFQLNIELH